MFNVLIGAGITLIGVFVGYGMGTSTMETTIKQISRDIFVPVSDEESYTRSKVTEL